MGSNSRDTIAIRKMEIYSIGFWVTIIFLCPTPFLLADGWLLTIYQSIFLTACSLSQAVGLNLCIRCDSNPGSLDLGSHKKSLLG